MNSTKDVKNDQVQRPSNHHEAFIEDENNCALCGSQLEIEVMTYLECFTLREEAYCPKCQLKTRIKEHPSH